MASKMLVRSRGNLLQICAPNFNRRSTGLILKRNLSKYKDELLAAEKHAQETWMNWRSVSLFVAVPVCSYLFYKHMIVGEHMEPPKEFIPYEHMRIRRKPFPWGDGDKSLFHNEKYNVGPDTVFDEEDEEHAHVEEEPFFTRLIRRHMEKKEDLIKSRDDHLRCMQKISIANLEYMDKPRRPPIPKDVFAIHDSRRKAMPTSVDQ